MPNQERESKAITSFLVLAVIVLIILYFVGAFNKEKKWSLIVGTEKDDLAVIKFDEYSDKTQCLDTGNSFLEQQVGNYTHFECGQDCSFSNTGKSVICKITCDNTGCSD